MGGTFFIFAILILILLLIWRLFFYKKNAAYWNKTGLPQESSSLLYFMFKKTNIIEFDKKIYNKYKEKTKHGIGVLWGSGVADVWITKPDLIKNILVKDFEYFVNRRAIETGKDELIQDFLTSLENQEWKDIRSHLSPLFTTGKIKRMFEIFDTVGIEFIEFLKNKSGAEVDIRKYIGKYTLGVISKVVFGMSYETFNENNTEFEKNVKELSTISKWRILKFMVVFFFPKLSQKMKIKILAAKTENYFRQIVKEAVDARKKYPEQKWNDFLELLLEAQNQNQNDQNESEILEDFEKEAQVKSAKKKVALTDSQIVANCLLFLVAGFDTTETALIWTIYELVKNPDVQEKLRNEIDKCIEKNGKISYETIMNMEYLDKVIQETLRKYPPGARLERRCEKDYTVNLDELNFTIPKGTYVQIPVSSLHNDEDYWTNPEKFDPDRFSKDEKEKILPYTYLPFGSGPRNCIGMRFALTEVKVCVAHLISEFEIIPTKKTPIPVSFGKFSLKPEIDIWLSLKARK